MVTNNSANEKFSNNSDGYALGGGTTKRTLTVTGGNVTLTGGNANVYTYPASTSTLASLDLTETFTAVKTFAEGIQGTATNDSAASGIIGELISSNLAIGSALSVSTGTTLNITSISLTAGDWDVEGVVGFIANTGTVPTLLIASISQTSATLPTSPNGGAYNQIQATLGTAGTNILPTGKMRISLASTTTVYLVAQATFSVSTLTGYGFIGARRVR